MGPLALGGAPWLARRRAGLPRVGTRRRSGRRRAAHAGPGAAHAPGRPWLVGVSVPEAGAEADYAFRVDGGEPLPDPRSAWQPHGVHGPSRTFDPAAHAWTDAGWPGPRGGAGVLGAVFYELHVGTFTAEGTSTRRQRATGPPPSRSASTWSSSDAGRPRSPDGGAGGTTGSAQYAVHDGVRRSGRPRSGSSTRPPRRARRLPRTSSTTTSVPVGNYLSRVRAVLHRPARSRRGARRSTSTDLRCRGARVGPRQRAALVPRLPPGRAAAGRGARAARRLAPARCSPSCPTRSPGWRASSAVRWPSSPRATSTTRDRRPTPAGGLAGMTAQWDDDIHHALHSALTGEATGLLRRLRAADGVLAADADAGRSSTTGGWSSFRGASWGVGSTRDPDRGQRFLAYLQTPRPGRQPGPRATGSPPP